MKRLLEDAISDLRDALLMLQSTTTTTPLTSGDGEVGNCCEAEVEAVESFRTSVKGLRNLQCAVSDIEDCVQDILTLKSDQSSMVYF